MISIQSLTIDATGATLEHFGSLSTLTTQSTSVNAGTYWVNQASASLGLVQLGASGVLRVESATLSGGTIHASNGAMMTVGGSNVFVSGVHLDTDVTVHGFLDLILSNSTTMAAGRRMHVVGPQATLRPNTNFGGEIALENGTGTQSASFVGLVKRLVRHFFDDSHSRWRRCSRPTGHAKPHDQFRDHIG